jgi:hypothetical protein
LFPSAASVSILDLRTPTIANSCCNEKTVREHEQQDKKYLERGRQECRGLGNRAGLGGLKEKAKLAGSSISEATVTG